MSAELFDPHAILAAQKVSAVEEGEGADVPRPPHYVKNMPVLIDRRKTVEGGREAMRILRRRPSDAVFFLHDQTEALLPAAWQRSK